LDQIVADLITNKGYIAEGHFRWRGWETDTVSRRCDISSQQDGGIVSHDTIVEG
jgi:hypothetical protein